MVHVYPLDYKSNIIWLEPFRLSFDYQMVSFVVLSYCCNHILHITLSLRAELLMFLFVMVLDPSLCLQKKKLVIFSLLTTLKPLYASRFKLCNTEKFLSSVFVLLYRLVQAKEIQNTNILVVCCLHTLLLALWLITGKLKFPFSVYSDKLSSSSQKYPSHHKIHKVAKLKSSQNKLSCIMLFKQ